MPTEDALTCSELPMSPPIGAPAFFAEVVSGGILPKGVVAPSVPLLPVMGIALLIMESRKVVLLSGLW